VPAAPLRFEIFCRVVDNYGDAGVCWRVARQLAREHGFAVRLWIDRVETLAAFEPRAKSGARVDGVEIERWDVGAEAEPETNPPSVAARCVVVSAFGCALPAGVRRRVADGGPHAPLWVNLEYLSAEDWVDGCHGLASAQPADGALEHCFCPGYTARTGGLPRERGLLAARDAFLASGERDAWLAARGLASRPGERRVSVFCYPSAPLAALLETIAAGSRATRVFVPAGVGDAALEAFFGAPLAAGHERARGALTLRRFALLTPDDYDRLLWSCAVNFVRGEDSWVRAQWAGAPFVWQPYPQAAGAHFAKLDAFLARMTAVAGEVPQVARTGSTEGGGCAVALDGRTAGVGEVRDPRALRIAAHAAAALFRAWSGDGDLAAAWAAYERAAGALQALHRRWCAHLAGQPDLVAQLAEFCKNRL